MKLNVTKPIAWLAVSLAAACANAPESAILDDPSQSEVPAPPASGSAPAPASKSAAAQPERATENGAASPHMDSQPKAVAASQPSAASPQPQTATMQPTAAAAPSTPASASPEAPKSAAAEPSTTPADQPSLEICYSEASSNHPATLAFWDAFNASDYAARDALIAKLEAATQEHPDEEEFAFLLAHANLWRAAEAQSANDLLLALDSALAAEKGFERASALCPTDARIAAWLGPMKILNGRLLGESARREEGERILAKGIELYPSFVSFSNFIAYGDEPLESPNFKKALDSARYFVGLNDGTDSYCQRTGDSVCSNSERIPHNLQGLSLYVGDVFVKARDRDLALKAYKLVDIADADTQSWPFRTKLEQRIRDVDANIAAASSASEDDDLAYAWKLGTGSTCASCHRR